MTELFTTRMTMEEMQHRIQELEAENYRLLQQFKKQPRTLMNFLENQSELAFVFPHYDSRNSIWRKSAAENFAHLRGLSLKVIEEITEQNETVPRKIANLPPQDYIIVKECAEEIVSVMAKYKKRYLCSIGQEDIIEAFGLAVENN